MLTDDSFKIENIRGSYIPIVDEGEYPGKISMILVISYVSPKDRKAVKEDVIKTYNTENILFREKS
ncbi:MAG: hypothetical protein V1678_03755 [Candidatus Aenigmatarchaeota archaeon]